jgi:UDP-glucose 4-epimerase
VTDFMGEARAEPGAESNVFSAEPAKGYVPTESGVFDASLIDREIGEPSIVVTGICGRLGKLLTRELHRSTKVCGIDRRPFPDRPRDVVHHQFDLRRSRTKDVFRHGSIQALVHLGVLHDPHTSPRERHQWNVVGFQKLLNYAAQFRVPKVIVLSGAGVYGAHPGNPQFLPEDAPLLGAQENDQVRDLIEMDMLAQSHFWRYAEAETVILRPCNIVGAVRNAASNYLRLARPVRLLGFDPMVQVIDERDVVRAIMLALRPGVRGIFNLRGQGELPLSKVLERAGKTPITLPAPALGPTLDRLFRVRLSGFSYGQIDFLRYPCMVDDTRARRELGFDPAYALDETLGRLHLEA